MAPKFGTSGLRGLVTELTEPLVRAYTAAFLGACPQGSAVFVGRDLRPSSPQIAGWVIAAIRASGRDAVDCGALPTPALALAAQGVQAGAVMVTGSHIPADRNGLKFYRPDGEISKQDELRITEALGDTTTNPLDQSLNKSLSEGAATPGALRQLDAQAAYAGRYAAAYGTALTGLRIGVYQHSSVARDLMMEVCNRLGATAIAIARSDSFVPVDTEALDPDTQALFASWFAEHDLDVLISTDGDADRPMVVDEARRVVPGDVLGALSARALGARQICTPVSSNSMISDPGFGFEGIARTRIGSPFVIAAMEDALAAAPDAQVVGYEANGGFLLGFEAMGPAGPLAPLMTRDCLLPILAPLAAARAAGQSLAALVDALPPVFTAADRLQGIETAAAQALLHDLRSTPEARAAFLDGLAREEALDETDGLRMICVGGKVIHLRPSGNAPEFRCYVEAPDRAAARTLLAEALDRLRARLTA